MTMVLMPVPYIDVSGSAGFPGKWQRALVAASGMIVETFCAALAMIVWLNAEPGLAPCRRFQRDAGCGRLHSAVQRQSPVALRRLLHPVRSAGGAEPCPAVDTILQLPCRPLSVRRAGWLEPGERAWRAPHLRSLCARRLRLPDVGDALHRPVHRHQIPRSRRSAGNLDLGLGRRLAAAARGLPGGERTIAARPPLAGGERGRWRHGRAVGAAVRGPAALRHCRGGCRRRPPRAPRCMPGRKGGWTSSMPSRAKRSPQGPRSCT